MLSWPNKNEDIDDLVFTDSDTLIIKKSDVFEILQEKGYGKNELKNEVDKFLTIANPANNKKQIADGISINVNFSLSERPINIVIKKDLLVKKALLYRQKICPQCGNVLVNRTNKSNNNEFLGCSGYPNCKYTSKLTDFIPLNNCFNDEE